MRCIRCWFGGAFTIYEATASTSVFIFLLFKFPYFLAQRCLRYQLSVTQTTNKYAISEDINLSSQPKPGPHTAALFHCSREVPSSVQNDWRELFLRGESLSGGGNPAELSATSVPGDRQQALLQQQDLAEYLAVSGRWVIPGASAKKRTASAQAREDSALRVESAVVTGFVVHRLLRLVYPPKSSVNAPHRPTFTLMGVVMGKSYTGKTHCLQWVETELDVKHIVMHDLVKRSLTTLERETQLELEAAGSGVMETLRIDDILGPDMDSTEMQGQESEQLVQQQLQETAADSIALEEGEVRPGSDATAEIVEPPQDDSTDVQSDVQKEFGSQTKLKSQKSKEKTKGSSSKSGVGKNSSGKSKKSSKSASKSAESTESRKHLGDAEKETPKSPAQANGKTADPAKTPSGTKHVSSPSTRDVSASRQDMSRTAVDDGGVSDEDTDSPSEDTVRFEYSQMAQLGREVKRALESGEAVHDQTLAGLLLEAWRELPNGSGWIVEGFPNTLAQAELLEEQLVGKQYDSDEELDEVEIVVTPLPKPEAPEDTGGKDKGKKDKKDKGNAKKGKKGKDEPPPTAEASPSPPPPPPEPVRLRVKPFRRSQLVPDANRRERPPPTSGLDLVVELTVSDEVAQQRRCQAIDRVSEQPDSGNCQSGSDDHVTLAGKLFSYGRLREPLVEYYSERSVYHLVEADDLAAVETRLEKLIGASRAKQREEHRLAERRAAQLAAAENEPDSEPEPEPEQEPEVPLSAKGKGKSPKGGKDKSADAKGKKGKGKGKGGADSTAAAEDLPQIPAPPPMPTPGEMGYYFVDAPVPEGVAQVIKQNITFGGWNEVGGIKQVDHNHVTNFNVAVTLMNSW